MKKIPAALNAQFLAITKTPVMQRSLFKMVTILFGFLGYQLKAGHFVISINYVGCILCTIVVHRMHPTDMLCQFCTIDVLR